MQEHKDKFDSRFAKRRKERDFTWAIESTWWKMERTRWACLRVRKLSRNERQDQ